MADPADRGRLSVQDRVAERTATHAVGGVAGVVPHQDTLTKAMGRGLPNVNAKVSGQMASVDVAVAVAWGVSLDEVTAQVRHVVREQLENLVGLDVTRVDVTVKRIVSEDRQEPRVR